MSFKTGEKCPESGNYKFVGYTDKTKKTAPTPEERVIPMEKGETFPPVKSTKEGAYWEKKDK
jgi:hypothetical protein